VKWKDRARHYEGKMLEYSRRDDGNDKGSNGRQGKENELIHMKRMLAGNVEG
jgi:hypothetical protein